MTYKELQNKYLGKRIVVPFQKGEYGVESREGVVIGTCQFIGENSRFPLWGLQVTIDRMPIQNVDYTKIKLYEDYIKEQNKQSG